MLIHNVSTLMIMDYVCIINVSCLVSLSSHIIGLHLTLIHVPTYTFLWLGQYIILIPGYLSLLQIHTVQVELLASRIFGDLLKIIMILVGF